MRSANVLIAVVMLSLLVLPVSGQSTTPSDSSSSGSSARTDSVPGSTPQAGRSDKPTAQKEALDFAYLQIRLETERLDKLIRNAETVGKVMTTLVVAFVAIVSFFGYRSIKELKAETQASVANIVDKTLREKSKSGDTFEKLVKSLSSAQTRWAQIEENLDNLARFETLSGSQYGDAKGAYGMAKELSGKDDITPDKRRAALGYLLKIVELGEQGRVDPNLLFNASTVASEMGFNHEALKLATLSAHWDPKSSHLLRKSRLEDVFGKRFELKDHTLVLSQQPPITVRREAWMVARDLVGKGPTIECEMIFSEFHNIANRNRESGYVDDAIAVMEDLTKNEVVPSYAFVILSGFYAIRGDKTWLDDYLTAAREAIEILTTESPASTWYHHTGIELLKMAETAGKIDEIVRFMRECGLKTGKNGIDGKEE